MSDPGDELVFAQKNLETAVILMTVKIDCAGEVEPLVSDTLYLLGEEKFSALGKYQGKIGECYNLLKSFRV